MCFAYCCVNVLVPRLHFAARSPVKFSTSWLNSLNTCVKKRAARMNWPEHKLKLWLRWCFILVLMHLMHRRNRMVISPAGRLRNCAGWHMVPPAMAEKLRINVGATRRRIQYGGCMETDQKQLMLQSGEFDLVF